MITEHDKGFMAGVRSTKEEALRIVASHIDRLEPGRQQKTRDALLDLEAEMRNNLDRVIQLLFSVAR